MFDLILFRRRRLGYGTCRGLEAYLKDHGLHVRTLCSNYGYPAGLETKKLFRWGCTASAGVPNDRTWNKSLSIHRVADKAGFAFIVSNQIQGELPVVWNERDLNPHHEWVVRPLVHSQGRHLYLWDISKDAPSTIPAYAEGWYARPLIKKAHEWRVYIFNGRVFAVAEKIPDNPEEIAWNRQGDAESSYVNVRWGSWDMSLIRKASAIAHLSGLNYAAVDMMTDEEGNHYHLEVNSAGSLPLNSDGQPSYRQRCLGKCILYDMEHSGFRPMPEGSLEVSYRDFIHPALLQG